MGGGEGRGEGGGGREEREGGEGREGAIKVCSTGWTTLDRLLVGLH